MRRNGKSSKNRGVRRTPARNWAIDGPPKYIANTAYRRRLRYQLAFVPSAGIVSWTFTPAKFAFTQVIAATTLLGVSLIEAAKIHRLDLFATPPADGSVIDIGVTFNGAALGIQGDDTTGSAQTFGMSKGAHVRLHPRGQAGQWQNTTSAATSLWFTIYVNSSNPGSATPIVITLDLDCSFRATTDSRVGSNTIPLVTATVSDYYYMALDNSTSGGSSGNIWKPDRSLNTTV